MKRSSHSAKPDNLSELTHRRLDAYAFAASAAGAGMLALVQPAEAKIIYTAAHVKITPNHTIALDLNHDGIKDFTFKNVLHTSTAATSFRSDRLSIIPANANQVWGRKTSVGSDYASALMAGVKVGASVRSLRVPDPWRSEWIKAAPIIARASGTTYRSAISV